MAALKVLLDESDIMERIFKAAIVVVNEEPHDFVMDSHDDCAVCGEGRSHERHCILDEPRSKFRRSVQDLRQGLENLADFRRQHRAE